MRVCDYYQLLGVSREASEDSLRRAFRTCVLKVHPDRNPGDELAPERARRVIEAYQTLRDAKRRRRYDVALAASYGLDLRDDPEVPPRYYFSAPISRMIFSVLAMVLLAYVGFVVVQASFADQAAIRPFLTEIQRPMVVRTYPTAPQPDVSDYSAWYHSQEYQLSMAHGFVANEMVKVYANAADQAARRGNHAGAHFYRSLIKQSQDFLPSTAM